MAGEFPNQPKILRGAFVEYGLSIPPLFVVFQFNPVQLTRNRSSSFSVPGGFQQAVNELSRQAGQPSRYFTLREYHGLFDNLTDLRNAQDVRIQPETVSFEIRLDATDKLNDGDAIVETFGIAPELSTLELMMHPKSESILGSLFADSPDGFSFTDTDKPPMVLFIWGRKRVLPVNINSMNITETEFSNTLDPIRATVNVNLTVIEGPNVPYQYTKVLKEAASALNLANIGSIADVVIPG
ncbi:MAG: hypothetical protein KDE19_07020 [Caldilineaceae bacterium]|nr:hypothetical protein [Caldilineaceae bacterium]